MRLIIAGLFGAISLSALLITCSKDEVAPPPTISSFTPSGGGPGTIVTINGTNFSSNAASNIVKFDGFVSIVTGSSPTALTALVPIGAASGVISVSVGGQAALSADHFITLLGRWTLTQETASNCTDPNNNGYWMCSKSCPILDFTTSEMTFSLPGNGSATFPYAPNGNHIVIGHDTLKYTIDMHMLSITFPKSRATGCVYVDVLAQTL